jgi:hypothetical protein
MRAVLACMKPATMVAIKAGSMFTSGSGKGRDYQRGKWVRRGSRRKAVILIRHFECLLCHGSRERQQRKRHQRLRRRRGQEGGCGRLFKGVYLTRPVPQSTSDHVDNDANSYPYK